ncbi:restriction endonuclease subunit S [Oceanobacter sp. 4_MG-2023]|uniref:restriction endonuclease subunit S n=1 Tax=Oceanobacter sp. 4_MG-2023 TaxID=3062623 RepID=UPI00273560BC|nr:restriction endonuclease subunit S [Oceanobacter sp. 4_MG-2023]MDP2547121.1 restriction endonuclease subunit S [Oceanobacter sp. 4_MG-2023]
MSNTLNGELGSLVQSGGGKIHTGPFGSQLHASDYVAEGIPCIMPANMKNSRVDLSNIAYITVGDAQRLSKYIVKENDIVYSRRGDVTQKALIRKNEEGYFCGTGCLLIRPGKKFDARFLTYYLSIPKIQSWIVSQAVGATMPNLNTGILSSIPFHGPEKLEQERVANVLSAIEGKIELNNRINAELEAMAKTLYDYWFVQFDFPDDSPQGQGKPYKTSGGKMVYNPTLKREIPEGWEDTPLSSITGVSNDSINPADYPEKLFKHFSIPVFDATNTFGVERGDTIGSNKFTVEETDLLVSKLNPWFNRVVYAMVEPEQICSTEFVVWRCPNTSIKNFMYMIATSPQFIAHCTQSATGTSNSHKRVNPNVMMRFDQPFNLKVAEKLGQHLEPILKQLIVNQRENTKLASLRDWLLPMLMNGQVTVK